MVHLLLAVIYLSFISLGLPDALLGAAWPSMYGPLGVTVKSAGLISMLISGGTIASSLMSDRLTRRLGPGLVTALSVGLTALALLGFSLCRSYPLLCVLAVPYGLGAGSVDAALNNYVALHYKSRHMSWLHCMWGIGAFLGPVIMERALTGSGSWPAGYRTVGFLQVGLTAVLFLSLPLWKKRETGASPDAPRRDDKPLTAQQILDIPGAPEVMVMFLCYCALESTAGMWAASYLVLHRGLTEARAAGLGGLFYLGITAGRAVSGFLTIKLSDDSMIRLGLGVIALGLAALLLPLGEAAALAGLVLLGLGCAPIYPSVIHSTPRRFGADRSQAVIGVQMASAYLGSLLVPPLFGLLTEWIGPWLYPFFLLAVLALMTFEHVKLQHLTA